MRLMQENPLDTWASGRGLGPGSLYFFGPQMALAWRIDAISQGPKKSRTHCLHNRFARIKSIMYGAVL